MDKCQSNSPHKFLLKWRFATVFQPPLAAEPRSEYRIIPTTSQHRFPLVRGNSTREDEHGAIARIPNSGLVCHVEWRPESRELPEYVRQAVNTESLTGINLGQYRVVAPLSEGGIAAEYRAYQPEMERFVARKILPRHLSVPVMMTSWKKE